MAKLSAKSYYKEFGDTPDYVVMFLPDEGFFRAAWEQDPSLVETGVRSRVHVASPTTLIVLLQSIAYGWQQESVAEDAREIQKLGRELYERFGIVGGHLNKIGNSLKGAVGAFNDDGRLAREAAAPDGTEARGVRHVRQGASGAQPRARAASGAPGSAELGEQLRAIDAA